MDEAPQRATSVPIRLIEGHPGTFSTDAIGAWEREVSGGLPAGTSDAFATHLDEVILNAWQHAWQHAGLDAVCVVAGQVFPRTRMLDVAIVDDGVGIRDALKRNPEHIGISSHEEAIRRATEYAVTGAGEDGRNLRDEQNSGIGLAELRDYCEQGGGEMTIVSGNAIVAFGGGFAEPVSHPLYGGGFCGTLVNFRFHLEPGRLTEPSNTGIVW